MQEASAAANEKNKYTCTREGAIQTSIYSGLCQPRFTRTFKFGSHKETTEGGGDVALEYGTLDRGHVWLSLARPAFTLQIWRSAQQDGR